jgi:hypothetical protein
MADRITYVGLDVHKERIVVAVASGGLRGRCWNTAGSQTQRRRWTVCCTSFVARGCPCGFVSEDGVIPARRFRFP